MIFDLPKEQSSIIKVIGVGGGGCNAVNHMYQQGIKDVNFVICNTDQQALDMSIVPNKIQLGPSLTKGRGAGSHPSMGEQATMESLQEIKELLERNTEMVFITAGMGGGTGTGGAPVIAKIARDMNILTIGIVTIPFLFEGRRRKQQALEGLEQMKNYVDAILVISNDKLREIFGNLPFHDAFAKADDILTTAAKGIAEIITVPGYVNVDFEDVKTVLRNSGLAIMGSSLGEGDGRALKAVEAALASPLLHDNDIRGARNILLNISSGIRPVLMDEISEITEYVQAAAGNDCDIIWGNCTDEMLGEKLMVTLIATGFETTEHRSQRIKQNTIKITHVNTNDYLAKKEISAGVYEEDTDVLTESNKSTNEIIHDDKKQKAFPDEENPRQFTFEFGGELFEIKTDLIHKEPELHMEEKSAEENKSETEETIIEEKIDEVRIEIKKEVREAPEDTKEEKELKPVYNTAENKGLITNNDKLNVANTADAERLKRLKSLSMKLNNFDEIEKTPAYMRRNVELIDTPNAKDINVSKYTLSGDENSVEIKKNNSFLHDNVD